jgi:hypothetical protein
MNLLSKYFYIDTRSLRLFRMLLALVIFFDLIVRISDLTAHYTEQGVLPLQALFKYEWNDSWWSFLILSPEPLFSGIFFSIIILSALFLLVGFKPRLMTFFCWIGLVSIQNRNPIIYQGGDDLLRMLTFWSIFLPLQNDKEKFRVSNLVTIAILLQVLFALQFSSLFKDQYQWWTEGSAAYYALSLDQISRPVGVFISEHYSLSVFLTRLVFLIEFLTLPLFLLPFFREQIRIIVTFLLLSFAFGIMLCMMIGIFPFCFVASSALFIPTSFWNYFERKKNLSFFTNYLISSKNANLQKPKNKYYLHWITQSFLGFFFTLIILWNIASLPRSPVFFPSSFSKIVYSMKLDQSWGMFAPTVFTDDGWLVIKADLSDGSTIDLNNMKLPSFEKPENVLSLFKNDRWRKYTEQIYVNSNKNLRPYYASFLINHWNRHLPVNKKIKTLSIYYLLERTGLPTEIKKITPVLLYEVTVSNCKTL